MTQDLTAESCADDAPRMDFPLSVSGRRWVLRDYDERAALAVAARLSLPELVARLLAMRGVSPEDTEDFLNPTLRRALPDPSHMLDMDTAAERLADAVNGQEKVVIFGDYDVDGATSAALLQRFFRSAGLMVRMYIPDRLAEGYGPNTAALRALKEQGASVIVTVDCGTVSFAPLAEAKAMGLDVIIIDHHMASEVLPAAAAVVNPNRLDESSPHRHLAAVGLCFLLAVAVNRTLRARGWFSNSREEPDLMRLLDLVALGTVCDVMPLTGINRVYVAQGLKIMASRSNVGLRALADVASIRQSLTAYHAGFVLGPRINAGGRIGKADLGARLLATDDPAEALAIASELDRLNAERRALESLAMDEAAAAARDIPEDAPFLAVRGTGWHQGVVGIIASRLKDLHRRPVAVITVENGVGKASARSVTGVDLGAAVGAARMEGLIIDGGGHAMAAGFTVKEERIEELAAFISERIKDGVAAYRSRNTLSCDGVLGADGVTPGLAASLDMVGPFGPGNPEPRFIIRNARITHSRVVGEKHVLSVLEPAGPFSGRQSSRLKSVAFQAVGRPLGHALLSAAGREVHLAGKVKSNTRYDAGRAEFHIDDMAWAI